LPSPHHPLRGRAAFASAEAEEAKHRQDLQKAKEFVSNKFPDLKIKTRLAKIPPAGGEISFAAF